MNIKTNEYIRPNTFEYIRISEYSSHTGVIPLSMFYRAIGLIKDYI